MGWKRCGLVVFTLSAGLLAQELQVKTKLGKVEGKMDGASGSQVRAFLGVPFGQPPVGPLRWKPPVPAAKWKGVRQAKEFGPRCMQPAIYKDMVFRDPGTSEDCLSLNIWTPAKDKKAKLPVMVWIYGGGFLAGSTSERRQDGAHLATNGVVVVSMNYRLGIFGFFASHELAAESGRNAAGNYGLLDQTEALRWVQANIAAFGGDPAKVTLFGESAGSGSVSAQMASPLAKGLFQRAIGESGSALNGSSGLALPPLAVMEAQDEAFAKNVLGASTLAEQRAIPASQLLEAQMKKDEKGAVVRFLAGVDGYLLPENPTAIFAAGKQNDVPLLAGWNRDERGIDPKATVESFKALAAKELPGHVEEAMTAYAASDDAAAVRAQTDLAGDLFIAYATWRWLESQAATGKQPAYRYSFDLAPPADPNHPGGLSAYHSAEIPYVFGTLDLLAPFGYGWRPEDRKLSDAMQRYWTNFAKTGDPNGGPTGAQTGNGNGSHALPAKAAAAPAKATGPTRDNPFHAPLIDKRDLTHDGLAKWPVYGASTQWQVMHLAPELAARPDDHRNRDLFLDGLSGK